MTELLYLKDCYLRECDAVVQESGEGWVVLDRTVFYPTGGGQEHDTGTVLADGRTAKVLDVKKSEGKAKHFIDTSIPVGARVHCVVDWTRRYANMRMHTSQHLISAIALELFNVVTVGNQIHPDRSRIDFKPASFSQEDLRKIEDRARQLIAEKRRVSIYELPREEAVKKTSDRTNIDLLPPNVKVLRMVDIENYDVCPCGGTHIACLEEIGTIRIVGLENKGKERQRIEYVLEPQMGSREASHG